MWDRSSWLSQKEANRALGILAQEIGGSNVGVPMPKNNK